MQKIRKGNDSQAGSLSGICAAFKAGMEPFTTETDLKTSWDIDWNADENEAEDGENADNTSFVICVDDMMAAVIA